MKQRTKACFHRAERLFNERMDEGKVQAAKLAVAEMEELRIESMRSGRENAT